MHSKLDLDDEVRSGAMVSGPVFELGVATSVLELGAAKSMVELGAT